MSVGGLVAFVKAKSKEWNFEFARQIQENMFMRKTCEANYKDKFEMPYLKEIYDSIYISKHSSTDIVISPQETVKIMHNRLKSYLVKEGFNNGRCI